MNELLPVAITAAGDAPAAAALSWQARRQLRSWLGSGGVVRDGTLRWASERAPRDQGWLVDTLRVS